MSFEGHGHVSPREDGIKARCGGPAMCKVCQQEQAEYERFEREILKIPGVTIETLPDGTKMFRGIRLKGH
jgi:hypothetical protein